MDSIYKRTKKTKSKKITRVAKPQIELVNVCHFYGSDENSTLVLRDINFVIQPGEFVSITGRSGSGKSTLLNIVACLELPRYGIYRFEGCDVMALSGDTLASIRNDNIGFIFQNFKLLPKLSSLDNVALPLLYAGYKFRERRKIAYEKLIKVGLEGYHSRFPAQLSGGEQQRVAIARALVNRPKVIIADEPTGALDSETATSIMQFLRELNRRYQITLVLVTHESDLARAADRHFVMSDGILTEQQSGCAE